MSFNNQSITPAVKGIPHIVFRQGYWRVSPMPKPYSMYSIQWELAHLRARTFNDKGSYS